ncbi:hypothetical protein Dvina_27680 [Dactylosporangium vinaceum]|uniref:Glycosyltransferase RgtA/B/C/D-like domain-containing protein n=1 Tax=Dactylosporangium vinaceum TaxID=53362 RepID=A0ABV5MCG3_9ACTN|nr:hypothetical protein [Dactylosporangium vinaceum]UAB92165.1 hypothetical protein Dvina_27680 [Dactylosporangium vinaceum]
MRHLRWAGPAAVVVVAAAGLFAAYLRMARAVTVNSDGASNALQAWDLFHGNVLLRGWTLSDVSFYPTELVQYGIIQLVTGVTTEQIHIAAALSWTLVVCFAAWLARSAATSWRSGAVAAGVAVAVLVVPSPGVGYQTLLSSPNHTGSAVPLLIAWLLIDRARDRPWLPYAVGAVLAWGAMGDPLITFVGAAPLIAVTGYRTVRARAWRGLDVRLAAAGVGSVVVSHAALWLIEQAGGFRAPRPPIELSPIEVWADRAGTVSRMLGTLFGTARPHVQPGWVETTLQVVRVPGLLLAVVAVLVTAVAAVRGRADRVDAVLAAAIVCDLGAEIVSTLPIDLLATREVAPVLPLAAVLAARLTARTLDDRRAPAVERSARPNAPVAEPATRAGSAASPAIGSITPPVLVRRFRGAVLAVLPVVLAAQLITLVAYAPPQAAPIEGQEAAEWLQDHGMRYGLGSYWVSNNITVGTSRQVTVVPTLSDHGRLVGMCWQTHTDMYDPAKHDARFVLLEKHRPMYGTESDVITQYGPPTTRQDFPSYVIFVYGRNLLEGFATTC